jgi:holo-[acyl-carrier protein] synthase
MIKGIGIDLVKISRIRRHLKREETRFFDRLFTEREQIYSRKSKSINNQAEHFAARFAAKEAFFKALGTGWSHKLQWKDVEVVNNSDGKPDIIVHGEALAVLKKRKITNIQVSISHEPEYACGMVILE